MSHIAIYAGWYNENVSGPLAEPNVEFMPGAFAYHLHSFNASTIRSTNKRWVGPLLAKGATVTFGSVDEPYLEFTTDVTALLARWLLLGFTYGEAAYAAQPVLSWQTTIIGDPLYRPFVPNLSQRHEGLKKTNSPNLEWSYNRLCNLLLMNSNSPAKVVASLEELPLTQSSPILQEKLADLLIQTGESPKAIEALQKALKLSSSRQQKVRLTLNLASLFKTANKQEELFDLYSKFVVENRDYPNKLSIYKELEELAHKLGKIQEAESYDRIIKSLMPEAESTK
jgi:tetratricopeptide (TPR) repeat protein